MTRHFPRIEGVGGRRRGNVYSGKATAGRMRGSRVSGHTLEKHTVCPYVLLFYGRGAFKKKLWMLLGVLESNDSTSGCECSLANLKQALQKS